MEHGELRLKEGVFSMFEPDVLLPVQYFEALRPRFPLESEKRLMCAILADAVECYQKYCAAPGDKAVEKFDEVERWIMERDEEWFCSFDNICDTLGIDAQYLRCGLADWKERQLPPRPAANDYERMTATG